MPYFFLESDDFVLDFLDFELVKPGQLLRGLFPGLAAAPGLFAFAGSCGFCLARGFGDSLFEDFGVPAVNSGSSRDKLETA